MDENLAAFRTWCLDAFRYVVEDYGFQEPSDLSPMTSNPFQVRFTKGAVELMILGEGYGTVASVCYVTEGQLKVASQMLEPDWEPLGKPKKRKQRVVSQRDQISAAADRIRARDSDILGGNLSRLVAVATRWRAIRQKMGF